MHCVHVTSNEHLTSAGDLNSPPSLLNRDQPRREARWKQGSTTRNFERTVPGD